MRARGVRSVARIDDGVYTHVKIDGRLYRVENVIKALHKYRESKKAHDVRAGCCKSKCYCVCIRC